MASAPAALIVRGLSVLAGSALSASGTIPTSLAAPGIGEDTVLQRSVRPRWVGPRWVRRRQTPPIPTAAIIPIRPATETARAMMDLRSNLRSRHIEQWAAAWPYLMDAVHRRRRDNAAKRAGHAVTLVVGHDQQDVRGTFGRHDRRWPIRFGLVASILIVPPNSAGGFGRYLPSIVVVALGEPGVPIVCWAKVN